MQERQLFKDLRFLPFTPFGGNDLIGAPRSSHQTHRAALIDEVTRQRGSDADRIFKRGGRQFCFTTTQEEKVIDGQAKALENSLDRMRKHFDDDSQDETRRQLRVALGEARRFTSLMRAGWTRDARDEWQALDRELQTLAHLYDLEWRPY